MTSPPLLPYYCKSLTIRAYKDLSRIPRKRPRLCRLSDPPRPPEPVWLSDGNEKCQQGRAAELPAECAHHNRWCTQVRGRPALRDMTGVTRTHCPLCGMKVGTPRIREGRRARRGSHGRTMTLDHIVPKSSGGKDHFFNLMTLCSECNRFKGHQDPEVWVLGLSPEVQAWMRPLVERAVQGHRVPDYWAELIAGDPCGSTPSACRRGGRGGGAPG